MVSTARIGQGARPMLFAFLRRQAADVVLFNNDHWDAVTTAFLR